MPRPPLATPPIPHLDTPEEATFEKDLTRLINCYSKENGSDTPDFILAQYMAGCLSNFNATLQAREKWYGREIREKTRKPLFRPLSSNQSCKNIDDSSHGN